ncbi:MAG TPA: YraN family protein [Terriglobales bacterium]|nr:YraN family protein [Terriglobales bacterium]
MGLRLTNEVLPLPRARFFPRLLRALERAAQRLRRLPPSLPIHALGQRGEDLAYWSLRARGYTIVARNYRRSAGQALPEGEIDLIAFEGSPPTLVFIEVKTRAREGPITAEAAVDFHKRRHLLRLARAYRRRRGYTGPHRFDVVVIYGPDADKPYMRLHRDAFRG